MITSNVWPCELEGWPDPRQVAASNDVDELARTAGALLAEWCLDVGMAMTHAGWTREQICEAAGLEPVALDRLLAGECWPAWITLVRVATAVGVSLPGAGRRADPMIRN